MWKAMRSVDECWARRESDQSSVAAAAAAASGVPLSLTGPP